MKCPKCNAEVSDKSKFCTHCGAKLEVRPEKGSFCVKCGAPLKEGAKFCSKCGSAQGEQTAQPTQNVQSTPPAAAPAQSAPAKQAQAPVKKEVVQQTQAPVKKEVVQQAQAPAQQTPKKKKKSILPVVMITLILLAVMVVGGYFVLDKGFDIDPVALIMGDRSDGDNTEEDTEESTKKEADEQTEESDGSQEKEVEEVDPAQLEALSEQLKTAKTAYEEASYADAINDSMTVINQYIALGEKYTLDEETGKQITEAYNIAAAAAVEACKGIEGQEYGSALYAQMRGTLDPVLELASTLTEKGYEVDSAAITEYSDGVIPKFRDAFIKKINEITEREQWSRDEGWTYAEQAYSIQENGKTILFDENDLDDPLRLRYAYCLAWIMTKRCENGVADQSMTQEDAFNNMLSVLEETDYNLLVIQDIIKYGSAIQKDTSQYQQAYNAIVQKLKDEQNLSIVNSGVNSGTSVDVRRFWYFNDLSGDDAYKVDINNGTTQATRTWIRENIPAYFE